MTILRTTSIAVATAGLMAASAQAQTVSIGTLPQGSLSYSIGAAVAKVIGDKTDLNTRAIGIGGDNIYLPQVNQGRLEMSTAAAPSAIFASKGTGPYEGHKNPNLRVVARLLEFQTGYMVKKSSKIQSLADLKGLKVPSGFTSQKLVGTLVRATMKAEGLSYDNVKGVPVPNFVRGTDELVAGRVAVSYLAPGSGITRKAHASIGIRFISLKESPGSLKIIRSIAPGVFYTMVNPSKRMPYITKPVKLLGFDYLILAGSMLKNEIVYKSAKALHLNKKALVAGHGVFRGYKPKLIAKKGLGVPFHPGAAKYFKEAGLM
jgi:uncharacterized protein